MQGKCIGCGFGLALLLASVVPLIGDGPLTSNSDAAAVKATVTGYIEAYYTRDAARIEESLHPHYLKHTISGPDGRTSMSEKTGLQMVQDVRSATENITPIAERRAKITVLDVSGDMAAARLDAAHWVDYLTLVKSNGKWKIVSVVLRENY